MLNNFNSNFYIMTSTVIPVLYVALLVQFPAIGRILERLTDNLVKLRRGWAKRSFLHRRFYIIVGGFYIAFLAGVAILVLSVIGEIDSILALYRNSDNTGVRHSTLIAVIGLLVAALMVPSWTIIAQCARFLYIYQFLTKC